MNIVQATKTLIDLLNQHFKTQVQVKRSIRELQNKPKIEREAFVKVSEEVIEANNYNEHYETIIRSHVDKVLSIVCGI